MTTPLMLAAVGLRYVADCRWGTRKCMDMNRLKEMQDQDMTTTYNAAAGPMYVFSLERGSGIDEKQARG